MARSCTTCAEEVARLLSSCTGFLRTGTSFVWLCLAWQSGLRLFPWICAELVSQSHRQRVTRQRASQKISTTLSSVLTWNLSTFSGMTLEEWWPMLSRADIGAVHAA